MNAYERKQEARRERLERAADRAEAKAATHFDRADLREEKSGIPFGQPILVGHHSERKHRRAIERADSNMRAGIEAGKRARELRSRADSVGSGGISSDDRDATAKVRAKLERLEADQAMMRAANPIIRAAVKKGVCPDSDAWPAYAAAMREALGNGYSDLAAAKLLEKDFAGRRGFADYMLTNNSANIRRLKKRLEQLERLDARRDDEPTEAKSGDGWKLVEDPSENRIRFFFDGKPAADTRKLLKSRGFRWAPTAGAWQRQLTNSARYAAECVAREL